MNLFITWPLIHTFSGFLCVVAHLFGGFFPRIRISMLELRISHVRLEEGSLVSCKVLGAISIIKLVMPNRLSGYRCYFYI